MIHFCPIFWVSVSSVTSHSSEEAMCVCVMLALCISSEVVMQMNSLWFGKANFKTDNLETRLLSDKNTQLLVVMLSPQT